MSRKRVLIHAITWTTLVVFIVIASVLGIHFSNAKYASSIQPPPPPGFLDTSTDSETQLPPSTTKTTKQEQSFSQRMIGSNSLVNGEPVSEVRSNTAGGSSNPYVQSRPAYQKPAPYKPKLVLAKQLQLQPATRAGKDPSNPNLVTQTVYGFLDFTTTVGNTVMVFTPQTRNVEQIQPSSTVSSITATGTPESDGADDDDDDYSSTPSTTSTTARQPKLLSLNTEENDDEEPQITFLESSETDAVPQQTSTTPHSSTKSKKNGVILATAVVGEYVNLVTEPSTSTTTQKSKKATTSNPVEVRTQVNVVSSGDGDEEEKHTITTPKGFTLKLSNKSVTSSASSKKAAEPISNGTLSSTSSGAFIVTGTPSSVFAQVVATPLKSFSKFAHVTAQVVTPTRATSTSIKAPTASASPSTLLPKSQAAAKKLTVPPTQASPKTDVRTEQSVAASSNTKDEDDENDSHRGEEGSEEQFSNEEPPENDEEHLEEGEERDDEDEAEIKPTATTSPKPEDQTLYVLPQKPKEKIAQIYASKTAAPDSYSREPQLYVDIAQPARPFDNYYVTSTPSSSFSGRKQFRSQNPSGSAGTTGTRNEYSNRFANRFSRKQATSTESNELTDRPTAASYEEEAPSSPSTFTRTRGGSSGGNRFRSRNNRGSAKSQYQAEVEPTASLVYSNSVTATPSRRFSGGRTRNGAAAAKNYQEYSESSTPKSSRGGYSPSRQKVTITPTTSTSIYRFKLNRPTGRWRFKPSPKPKVSIIKSKEEEPTAAPAGTDSDDPQQQFQVRELLQQQSNGPVYPQQYGVPVDGNDNYQYAPSGGSAVQYEEDPRGENNELAQEEHGLAASPLESLVPTTIRVATVTPTEFIDLEKYLEIATIKSPYVFQAGNVKNTRYITVTKTFTKDLIQPTEALEVHETLENILATRAPYEKILEGSNDVATLPVVVLGEDMATPPLETVTQTFSTTQLMLKTSILPVLYGGVTTLYTLTQSYFVTRLVTAHKTVPPMELFQFVPTKSLTEFNTALQEAESEHREQLLGSEDSEENDQQYQQIVAAPDELKFVGSEFDPSFMEDKLPLKQLSKSSKSIGGSKKAGLASANSTTNAVIPDLSNLTPEQLAFFRFLTANQAAAQQHLQASPNPLLPNFFPSPQLSLLPSIQPQFQLQSSPIVLDTVTTIVETKTLRILFGAKPTQTTLYSTRVVPTKVTTYISAPVPTAAPALPQIPNYFQGAYPFGAYVG